MMSERRSRMLAAALCLWVPAVAFSADPPAPLTEPAPAPIPQTPLERTLAFYRSGPFAETVQLRVKDSTGQERRGVAQIRMDAGDANANRPRRGLLELGPLLLSIQGDRLVATQTSDNTRYAEFTLPKLPLHQALAEFFPALYLPELSLVNSGGQSFGDLGLLPKPGPVHWDPPVLDRVTGKMIYNGTADDAKFKVMTDRTTARLASVQIAFSSGPLRSLDLTIRSMDPGTPESWEISTQGRTRVDSLAEVRAPSESLKVGERFPAGLNIFSSGLALMEDRPGPAAFVFLRLETAGLSETDQERHDSAYNSIRRESSSAVALVRGLTKAADGKWPARCIAVIDGADLRLPITSSLLAILNPSESSVLAKHQNDPLFTGRQTLDFDAIFGASNTVVVVLDKSRTIRAIVPVTDADSAEMKVRAVFESLK